MSSISILGVFVADLAFFAKSIPVAGQTILGENYVIGPGGKGSNQAVAAAKAGAKTFFISKIGDDQFGSMAIKIYDEEGVDYSKVVISPDHSTGAAGILVDNESGKNAINVVNMCISSVKVFISFKLNNKAPSIVGIDSINEYLAASSFLYPRISDPVIAVPDLEAPEIKLNV